MAIEAVAFRVRGLVQGVGFRPFVWRLARRTGLTGEALNDGEGVLIRAWGTAAQLAGFEAALKREAPPLARVEAIERRPLSGLVPADFRIAASEGGAIATGIVPDAATCPECLAEVLDPADRRYRYPFTNCTHCGPRLSIIRAIPYDRGATSMAAFAMCAACRAEYDDPADRRFHAEPNACPVCGPRLWLSDADGRQIEVEAGRDAIAAAAGRIRAGQIVAIKGIGGFHLACDAAHPDAVARLRQRKHRFHKPLALMARDLAMVTAYAEVGATEADLLASAAAPVVVLRRRTDSAPLAPEVAPGQGTVGFMLPSTPLHHLLARELSVPFVLTSGNASDEPQVIDNAEALERLAGIADVWLMHDRDIVSRLDDSVWRVADQTPVVLRRARGHAPAPLVLAKAFDAAPRILAMGAELKSTFCLLQGRSAVLSQHIGDLAETAAHDDYRAMLALYRRLFAFAPEVVAIDQHPDYLSSQWGERLAAECGAAVQRVRHHHAHVAAVLAEHGVSPAAPPVLGIVLDGLGMGERGELWGGEFLCADYRAAERLAAFTAVPLLGGHRAMREPWRNAFAHLHQFVGWDSVERRFADLAIVRLVRGHQPPVLLRMLESGLNAPPASSAGRLFDAAAAILGIRPEGVSYEGQAAIELEALAEPEMAGEDGAYPHELLVGEPPRIGWAPLWAALLDDVGRGTAPGRIAARLHRGVVAAVAQTACELARARHLPTVVLSGGVFQNRILLEGVAQALRDRGLDVLTPRQVPANDGGIALGQAAVAAALRGS